LRKQFKRDGDHWSHDLGKKLAEARKNKKTGKKEKEEL
jgi:hypothetical protein